MDSMRKLHSDGLLPNPLRPSHYTVQQTPCSIQHVTVDLRVRAKVSAGYLMCVTGSSEELGAWDPLKAIMMKRSIIMDNEFHKEVILTRLKQHCYRFFICKPLVDGQIKAHSFDSLSLDVGLMQYPAVIIHKWESHIEPRVINTSEIFAPHGILPLTEFGWIGDQYSVGLNEWFVNTTEIRLSLSGEHPVHLFERDNTSHTLGIKCCPLDCGNAMIDTKDKFKKLGPGVAEDAALNRFLMVSSVSVEAFRKMIGPGGVAESARCHKHHFAADSCAIRFGSTTSYEELSNDNTFVAFSNGQSLIFHIYASVSETVGFRFEFYCQPFGHPKLFGTAFLLPFERDLSHRLMQIPIFGIETSPIGHLSLNCLVVRPSPGFKMNMKVSYQNHWKHRKAASLAVEFPLSFCTPRILSLKENTLASLKAAMLHDVQFIEFSVQLCKDKVPVIYHDFDMLVSAFNKVCKSSEIYSVKVKDLPLQKLQSATLHTFSEAVACLPDEATGTSDYNPFPTLCAALNCVPSSVGFIIVVKYPQCLDNGQMEVDNYFDLNTVVDVIVSSVMKNGASRKIIFASSDANTCIMLQKKQNMYPVIYRCQVLNSEHPSYQDIRAKSFEAAIHFAVLEKLLGVEFLTEEIIKDPKIIRKTHSAGLVLFAWSDKQTVRESHLSHIDAVVSSSIWFHLSYGMKKEVFYFSNRVEEIDLTLAHVVPGVQKHTHRWCK
ncbi:hypothetical protein BsWGS_07158 [Bradybaena similaris]